MSDFPALSCILTVTNGEGAGIGHSLGALMPLEGDFEVVVVDHGADAATRALLAGFTEPRLRVLRMAPASRGAARNRGLAHARGARVCVLAPGDTLAPFALPLIAGSAVDLLFLPAATRLDDGTLIPIGETVLDDLINAELEHANIAQSDFAALLTRLALLPAHAGMRVASSTLVRDHALAFAHDAGSGWLFSVGALMNAESLAVAGLPSVTLADEATTPDDTPFATLSDAAQALFLFERARHFHDPALRLALLGTVFADLQKRAACAQDDDRRAFENGCALILARSDARLRSAASDAMRQMYATPLADLAPALGSALDFAQALSGPRALSGPSDTSEPPRSPRQNPIARLAALAWGQSGGKSSDS